MNQGLKILIIEDSASFAIELDILVHKIGYTVQEIIDNAEEAYNCIQNEIPDLILLDIELKGKMTGIDLSLKIAHLEIPIIFITSSINETHYNKAKNSNTLAYLTKPMSSFSLKASIETAINNTFKNSKNKTENIKDHLFIKKSDVYHKIQISSIIYVQSNDNYCEVHTKNEKFLLRTTISNIIGELLPKSKFTRIHRQFIIQTNSINSINLDTNTLSVNEMNLPISKTYKKDLLEKVNI